MDKLITEEQAPKPIPTNEPTPVLYSARPKYGAKVGVLTLPTFKQSWTIHEGVHRYIRLGRIEIG